MVTERFCVEARSVGGSWCSENTLCCSKCHPNFYLISPTLFGQTFVYACTSHHTHMCSIPNCCHLFGSTLLSRMPLSAVALRFPSLQLKGSDLFQHDNAPVPQSHVHETKFAEFRDELDHWLHLTNAFVTEWAQISTVTLESLIKSFIRRAYNSKNGSKSGHQARVTAMVRCPYTFGLIVYLEGCLLLVDWNNPGGVHRILKKPIQWCH